MSLQRRSFLSLAAGVAGGSVLTGCASLGGERPLARVVVVGAGWGGATAARYLRRWEPRLEVTLVERNEVFVSCPLSNLVLAGTTRLEDLTRGYDGLSRAGIRQVRDEATAIDLDRHELRLRRGDALPYDRLILAPGIDFLHEQIPGLAQAEAQGRVLHAWKAGPQTLALRRQLEALPDGGVFALSIPKAPYRCPPGPYERVSLVASYFRQAKPRAKIVVLDANPDIVSKKGLFLKAWNELYPGLVEYRPLHEVVAVEADGQTVQLAQQGRFKADLLNIIPPQRAGRIAQALLPGDRRWVDIDFRSFEAQGFPGVHVIGDATTAGPGMPKSGFMANNHAKNAADAVIALLTGQPVNEAPIVTNTCYSFVSPTEAVHVASVHKWSAAQKTVVPVQGAGGLSAARSELEAQLAHDWARAIWTDVLG